MKQIKTLLLTCLLLLSMLFSKSALAQFITPIPSTFSVIATGNQTLTAQATSANETWFKWVADTGVVHSKIKVTSQGTAYQTVYAEMYVVARDTLFLSYKDSINADSTFNLYAGYVPDNAEIFVRIINISGTCGVCTYTNPVITITIDNVTINCSPVTTCDLVKNGGFESKNTGAYNQCGLGAVNNLIDCWTDYENTSDVFSVGCLTPSGFQSDFDLGSSTNSTITVNPNTINPNPHSTALAFYSNIPWNEAVQSLLRSPLIPGHTYSASMWAYNFKGTINNGGNPDNINTGNKNPYFSIASSPTTAYSVFTSGPGSLGTFFPASRNILATFTLFATFNTWAQYTTTFVATNSDQNIIIGAHYQNNLTATYYNNNSFYIFVDEVSIKDVSALSFTGNNTCAGTSATLTASGATTYTWQPGNLHTNSVTSNVNGATYTVTGSYAAGPTCTVGPITTSVNIIPQQTMNVTASPSNTICGAGTVTLTASGSNLNPQFLWTPFAPYYVTNAIVVSPTVTTTYTVNASGNSGSGTCSVTKTITVYVAPAGNPTLNVIASPTVLCSGSSTTLTASGGSTYTWTPGGATTASIAVSPTVTTSYTVRGSYSCGGTATTVVTVSVSPPPTLSISASSNSICIGSSVTLTGSGATSYTWFPVASTNTVLLVTPTITTTYTLIGKTGSCTNTKTITVTVVTPTISISGASAICSGNNLTLQGAGASTYTWAPCVGTCTTLIKSFSPTVTTSYTLTGTNSNGCIGSVVKTVTVNPKPIISIASTSICAGGTATLTASGGSTYNWSPSGITSPTITVTPSVTNVYTVTGYAVTGTGTSTTTCSQFVTGTVTVLPFTSLTANPSTICVGQTATLTAAGATSYTWNTGANTSSIAVTPTTTSSYTVFGSGSGCVSSSLTIALVVNANPTITAISSPSAMCVGSTATLTSTGAVTYSWSSGGTTAVTTVTPGAVSVYTVTGTTNGCSATNTVAIALTAQYCCLSSIATIGTSTSSSTNYSNNSNGAGAIIDMQGAITFSANTTMSNYIVRLAPQTSLIITPGVTVTFSNCTLYSCTELWYGISIPDVGGNAGNLNVINSTIEDMYFGIVLSGNSIIGNPTSTNGNVTVTNSKLNKNYNSILLNTFPKYNNGSTNYGLSVTGTTISSVYSPTSPQNTLKPSASYTYHYNTITNSAVPYVNFPRSFCGIALINLTEAPVIVGDVTGTGGTNRFENIDLGISVNNAYLKAYNNHFINLKGSAKQYATSPGPAGPDEIGVAIAAANTTTTNILYPIVIGAGTSAPTNGNPFPTGNKFENCYKGVKANNYKDIVSIKGNVFTSTLTSVTPLLTPTFPLYGYTQAQSGVWLNNTQVKAEVLNNYVVNHNNAIYSSHNILASLLSNAYIKIEDNLVEAPGTSGYTKYGIQVEQAPSTTNLNTGMLTVKNNTIQNVYGGIKAYNVKGGLQINSNPTINLDAAKLYGITGSVTQPANYARTAIYVQSCTDAVVANNPNITSNGTIPANYSTVKGIWMNASSGTTGQVNCNSISNMGRCMQFTGTSLNKVSKNVMNGTYQGLVLSVNGQIGTQGSISLTNDNEWNGFTGGAAQYAETYTEATSNANTNSNLFVKLGSPYQPTQNYSSSSFPYQTGPANGIDPQSSGTPGESCLSLKVMGGSNINTAAMKTSSTNEEDSTNTTIYESLVSDTTYYEVYQDETKYRNKQLVFDLLNTQSIDTTVVLQDFYTANQNSSYNDFTTINTAIGNADYSTAQNMNNAVAAVNTIETYQKRVNELLLKYLSYQPQPVITSSLSIPVFNNATKVFDDTELSVLNTIANSCLDKYGNVVTQARVLLNNISNRVIDFDDNCVPEYNQRKAKPSNQAAITSKTYSVLYPNPNNGNMILEYNLGIENKGEMRIFDITGKLVNSYSLTQTIGKIEISEEQLNSGIYYYSIFLSEKNIKTEKIVIIK